VKIEKIELERKIILKIIGNLDFLMAPKFETEIISLLNEGKLHFVLDLSELKYISVGGLNSLLKIQKNTTRLGGSLVFVSVSDIIMDIFNIIGFSKYFDIKENLEDLNKREWGKEQ